MFIGERTNNSNVVIDTDKLAQDIANKISIPTPSTIIEPINANTNAKIFECNNNIGAVESTAKTIFASQNTFLGNYNSNSAKYNTLSGINEYLEDDNKYKTEGYKPPRSLYNHVKHINAKVPDVLSVQYTTWTVAKTYKDNTQQIIGYLPIKITILPRHLRIKIYNGIQLYYNQEREPNIKQWELYLDANHLLMRKFGNGVNLEEYMDELFSLYRFDGGSGSIAFPLRIYDNHIIPPDVINTSFFLFKDTDTKFNLHLISGGVDAFNYQYIMPQTIETTFLPVGSYELI